MCRIVELRYVSLKTVLLYEIYNHIVSVKQEGEKHGNRMDNNKE